MGDLKLLLGLIVALGIETSSMPSKQLFVKPERVPVINEEINFTEEEQPISDLYDITIKLSKDSSKLEVPADTITIKEDLFYSPTYNIFFRKKGRNKYQSCRIESTQLNLKNLSEDIYLCFSYTNDEGLREIVIPKDSKFVTIPVDPIERELSFTAAYSSKGTTKYAGNTFNDLMNRSFENVKIEYK